MNKDVTPDLCYVLHYHRWHSDAYCAESLDDAVATYINKRLTNSVYPPENLSRGDAITITVRKNNGDEYRVTLIEVSRHYQVADVQRIRENDNG